MSANSDASPPEPSSAAGDSSGQHTTEVVASGRHLRLSRRNGWEFAERTGVAGVVVIVAVTDDGNLLLTDQFRPPVEQRVIDLPAGLAGDGDHANDEPLENAARRELREETGYTAETMQQLAVGPSSAGLTSELLTFFLAGNLTRVDDGGGDSSENITVHALPLDSIGSRLRELEQTGACIDPKIYAGLWMRQTAIAAGSPPAPPGHG